MFEMVGDRLERRWVARGRLLVFVALVIRATTAVAAGTAAATTTEQATPAAGIRFQGNGNQRDRGRDQHEDFELHTLSSQVTDGIHYPSWNSSNGGVP